MMGYRNNNQGLPRSVRDFNRHSWGIGTVQLSGRKNSFVAITIDNVADLKTGSFGRRGLDNRRDR